MNTLRACTTIEMGTLGGSPNPPASLRSRLSRLAPHALGLVASLVLASGCGSDSKSNTDGSVRRDTRQNANADTSSGDPCVFNGTTYQPGQSFTINCVRYTCQGGSNVTSSGSPCSDASTSTTDTRSNRDVAPASDAPRGPEAAADTNVGRDVSFSEAGVSEAGRSDTTPLVDVGGKDVGGKDVFVFQDTPPVTDVPPAADVAPPEADVAPATKCSYGGKLYNPGEEFACDCNTCICTSTGAIRSLTSIVCDIDAG